MYIKSNKSKNVMVDKKNFHPKVEIRMSVKELPFILFNF